jgi:hypothetical protein
VPVLYGTKRAERFLLGASNDNLRLKPPVLRFARISVVGAGDQDVAFGHTWLERPCQRRAAPGYPGAAGLLRLVPVVVVLQHQAGSLHYSGVTVAHTRPQPSGQAQ